MSDQTSEPDQHLMWVTGYVHAMADRDAAYPAGEQPAYQAGYRAAQERRRRAGITGRAGVLGFGELGAVGSYAAGVIPPGGIAKMITISDPRIEAARDATGFVPRQDVTPPMSVLLDAYYHLRRAALGLLAVIDGEDAPPAAAQRSGLHRVGGEPTGTFRVYNGSPAGTPVPAGVTSEFIGYVLTVHKPGGDGPWPLGYQGRTVNGTIADWAPDKDTAMDALLAAYQAEPHTPAGQQDQQEWWTTQERLDHGNHQYDPGCRLCAAQARAAGQARS